MYLQELQDVIDSVNLVDQFHNSQAVRLLVNTRFQYKDKRSVLEFISRLNTFSPSFATQWKKTLTFLNATNGLGARKYWSDVFKDKVNTQVGSFLEYCYASGSELDATLNRAINYYTQTNHDLTAEQIAYLRNLQMQRGASKAAGLTRFLKQNNKKAKTQQTAYNQAKNSPQQQAALQNGLPVALTPAAQPAAQQAQPTAVQQTAPATLPVPTPPGPDYATLGQPLSVPIQPAEMGAVAIHAIEPPQTATQANIPVNINQAAGYVRRVITSPSVQGATRAVGSELEVGLIRAQPVKRAENLVGYFANQLGLGGRPRVNYAKGIYGGRISPITGTRGVARVGRGAFFAGRLAAGASAGWALWVGVGALVLILMFFFITVMNPNAARCPVWSSCPLAGKEPGGNVPSSALIITKDGPDNIPNDTAIAYKITIVYKGVGTAKVDLTDKIPSDTKFSSASPTDTGVFERKDPDTTQETLVWHIELKSNEAQQVNFTVSPQKHDFWAINQANANITSISGGSGQGLLCVADVDLRLIPFFEQSAVTANLSPSLMYAVAKGEHGGGSIKALSLDGKTEISPCGAHGITQIQHPNDGTPGAPGKYSRTCAALPLGTSNPPESWDPLVSGYNSQTGGKLQNVDTDEDNIWGSSFFVRYFKINQPVYFSGLPDYQTFKNKGSSDIYTDQEIVAICKAYHGACPTSWASMYLDAYHNAIAAQGTCGNTQPASIKNNNQ